MPFFLLAGGLRRWLLLTVAVPLAASGARRLARAIETRRGPSGLTRGLMRAANAAHRSKTDAQAQAPATKQPAKRRGLLRRRPR